MNKTLDNMTVEEKVGQLFMVGFDALEPNEHIIELIRDYKIGNVILFARNVDTPEQVFTLNQTLQKLAKEHIGIPLYISIDQEGGMVTRIKQGSTFFPGAMTLAASNNVVNAYQTGLDMGEELHYLGINMNLAPSLDVNNNPHNPVIGVRSYSDDPTVVAECGSAFIKGLQKHVVATAKHFPGHGDTSVDSHLALPTIDIDQERFESVELVPFKHAINEGVQAIMSAHINFPLITEENRPCTLSYNALTKLLREKLGFDGLIVTDCMQMKAIQHQYTTPIGAKLAVQAGANIICVSHAKELQIGAYEAVLEAVQTGEITLDVLNQRVQKVLDHKSQLTVVASSFEDVQTHIISTQHKDTALSIVKSAVSVVRGEIPVPTKRTLVIAPSPLATTIADEDNGSIDIVRAIEQSSLQMDALRISIRLTEEDIASTLDHASTYDQVVLCSYNANIHPSQITLMNALNHNKNLYVFTMRNPYDTHFAPRLHNVLNFYEYTPNSVQAVLAVLQGDLIPTGKVPVHYE